MTAGAYLEVLQENPSHKMIWGSFLAQPDQVGFDVSLPVTPVYSMSVGVAGVEAGGSLLSLERVPLPHSNRAFGRPLPTPRAPTHTRRSPPQTVVDTL